VAIVTTVAIVTAWAAAFKLWTRLRSRRRHGGLDGRTGRSGGKCSSQAIYSTVYTVADVLLKCGGNLHLASVHET